MKSKSSKNSVKTLFRSIGYYCEVMLTAVLTHPNHVKRELNKLKEKRNNQNFQ